jgi:predicted enzyme related to lactoylglutathione lyase
MPGATIGTVTKVGLVLDCANPEELAKFWAAALDYEIVGGAGAYVMLVPKEPGPPQLLLQRVGESKSAKNRMHLDIHVADIDAEAARLEGLGATRVSASAFDEHGTRWHLMADPEGNELCVCNGGASSSV